MSEPTKPTRCTVSSDSKQILDKCEVMRKKVAEHLREYPPLESDGAGCVNCPICTHELSGLFGSFAWAIVHGEGFCNNCRFPVRLYHYLEDGCPTQLPFNEIPWPHKVTLQYYFPFVSESKWPRMRELWEQAEQNTKRFVELYNSEEANV